VRAKLLQLHVAVKVQTSTATYTWACNKVAGWEGAATNRADTQSTRTSELSSKLVRTTHLPGEPENTYAYVACAATRHPEHVATLKPTTTLPCHACNYWSSARPMLPANPFPNTVLTCLLNKGPCHLAASNSLVKKKQQKNQNQHHMCGVIKGRASGLPPG
jgi:hypothetical protein